MTLDLWTATSRLVIRGQPGQSLVEAVAGCCARRLHVPIPVTDSRQAELFLDLVGLHRWKREGGEIA